MPAASPTGPSTPGKASTASSKSAGGASSKVAAAPGSATDAPGSAEATTVAEMFAALVASITQQMQPVETTETVDATATAEVTAEGATPAVLGEVFATPGLVSELIDPALSVTTPTTQPNLEGVTGVTGAPEDGVVTVEAPAAADVAPIIDGVATTDVPDADDLAVPVVDTEGTNSDSEPSADSDTDGGARGAHRAQPSHGDGPAVPAQPASSAARDERPAPPSGTIPAQPAVPAAGGGAAQPAVPATPAADRVDADVRPVNVAGVAPTAGPSRPTAVEAPAPVAVPAPPADAHVQIARVVRPLRLGNDGAYELALDLTPAELGRVRIDVELRGATISLNLRADNPATRELLQTSLGQLRSELEAAGLHAGNLDVGGRGPGEQSAPGQERNGAATTSTTDAGADTPVARTDTNTDELTADGTVDVLA
jgi:flagellar hook-length control protein FliK